MQPLEQYEIQLHVQLAKKLYYSIEPQLGDDLWSQLQKELRVELMRESHEYPLKQELAHQCL